MFSEKKGKIYDQSKKKKVKRHFNTAPEGVFSSILSVTLAAR